MPRYLVNLGMSAEVEADNADEAIAQVKQIPIREMNVYHTQAQQLIEIDPETHRPVGME